MAITNGFTANFSDVVVLDQDFGTFDISSVTQKKIVSTYVLVDSPGDIVYQNESKGQNAPYQFILSAPAGLIPIAATRIVSGPVDVNGTPRSTTASNMTWMAETPY